MGTEVVAWTVQGSGLISNRSYRYTIYAKATAPASDVRIEAQRQHSRALAAGTVADPFGPHLSAKRQDGPHA